MLIDTIGDCLRNEKGVSVQSITCQFGVTPRTIQYTVHREKHRRRDSGTRTKQVSVTVMPEELRNFDVVLGKQGVTSRSEGLRGLIRAANAIFLPDEHLADELKDFRAALNRVGNNVTQIAKRMNEANNKGMRPPFGPASLGQM